MMEESDSNRPVIDLTHESEREWRSYQERTENTLDARKYDSFPFRGLGRNHFKKVAAIGLSEEFYNIGVFFESTDLMELSDHLIPEDERFPKVLDEFLDLNNISEKNGSIYKSLRQNEYNIVDIVFNEESRWSPLELPISEFVPCPPEKALEEHSTALIRNSSKRHQWLPHVNGGEDIGREIIRTEVGPNKWADIVRRCTLESLNRHGPTEKGRSHRQRLIINELEDHIGPERVAQAILKQNPVLSPSQILNKIQVSADINQHELHSALDATEGAGLDEPLVLTRSKAITELQSAPSVPSSLAEELDEIIIESGSIPDVHSSRRSEQDPDSQLFLIRAVNDRDRERIKSTVEKPVDATTLAEYTDVHSNQPIGIWGFPLTRQHKAYLDRMQEGDQILFYTEQEHYTKQATVHSTTKAPGMLADIWRTNGSADRKSSQVIKEIESRYSITNYPYAIALTEVNSISVRSPELHKHLGYKRDYLHQTVGVHPNRLNSALTQFNSISDLIENLFYD